MKTNIYITIIAVIIIVITISCSMSKNQQTTEVVVIRDITSPHLSMPEIEVIQSLYKLNVNKWQGAIFRLTSITDISYNKTYEARIEAENKWLENEFERRKKIKTFFDEIGRIINLSESHKYSRNKSSVYSNIAKELNKLSKSKSHKKIILIYSDLAENTNEMSFYKNKDLYLLKNNTEKLTEYFNSITPLLNLENIEVFLIYQPENSKQDDTYRLLSGYYKTLLENKGANVEITANIN